jgi:hypothetical protein
VKTPTGFECTDEDMSAGGHILPRDPRAVHVPTKAERKLLDRLVKAVRALEALGWRDSMYAPKGEPLLLIEARSTGIHEGHYDDIGFWIYDGDTWPSRPILFKPKPASNGGGAEVSQLESRERK